MPSSPAIEDTMVYFTGGVAWADTRSGWGGGYSSTASVACATVCTNTRVGWVAGVGLEHMLTPNWTFRGEVLYYAFGTTTVTNVAEGKTSSFDHEVVAARLALSYKW